MEDNYGNWILEYRFKDGHTNIGSSGIWFSIKPYDDPLRGADAIARLRRVDANNGKVYRLRNIHSGKIV